MIQDQDEQIRLGLARAKALLEERRAGDATELLRGAVDAATDVYRACTQVCAALNALVTAAVDVGVREAAVDLAIGYADKAIQLEPHEFESYLLKAKALALAERYDEALADMMLAEQNVRFSSKQYYDTGVLFEWHVYAIYFLEQAVRLDAHFSLAWIQLMLVLHFLDRPIDAVSVGKRAMLATDGSLSVRANFAGALARSGDSDLARAEYIAIVELIESGAPTGSENDQYYDSYIDLLLFEAYMRLYDLSELHRTNIEYMRKALRLRPDSQFVRLRLAMSLLGDGREEEARTQFEFLAEHAGVDSYEGETARSVLAAEDMMSMLWEPASP